MNKPASPSKPVSAPPPAKHARKTGLVQETGGKEHQQYLKLVIAHKASTGQEITVMESAQWPSSDWDDEAFERLWMMAAAVRCKYKESGLWTQMSGIFLKSSIFDLKFTTICSLLRTGPFCFLETNKRQSTTPTTTLEQTVWGLLWTIRIDIIQEIAQAETRPFSFSFCTRSAATRGRSHDLSPSLAIFDNLASSPPMLLFTFALLSSSLTQYLSLPLPSIPITHLLFVRPDCLIEFLPKQPQYLCRDGTACSHDAKVSAGRRHSSLYPRRNLCRSKVMMRKFNQRNSGHRTQSRQG
jgi:hypothetical protein